MTVPRINLKNIDYFKFKKLVIDGVRDDYASCSKEVKCLCDDVQTLNFRDEEFDDISDRGRLMEICTYYKQIMASKRIAPLDMRIKSGWWGDHKNAYSAGKLKPAILKDTLVNKSKQWTERHGGMLEKLTESELQTKIDGPGLFVIKHKEHQCFQYVGRADKIFPRVAEKLKAAFETTIQEPLAALLVISMAADWEFYFIPIAPNDEEGVLRILENDLILRHDSIWPHGLNFRLLIDSLLEVSEFRKSCLRHHWPPEGDSSDGDTIDLSKLRQQIATMPPSPVEATPPPTPKPTKPKAKGKTMAPPSPPPFRFTDIEMDLSPLEVPDVDIGDIMDERPGSGMSNVTYVVPEAPSSPSFSVATFVKELPATFSKEAPPVFVPKPIKYDIPVQPATRPISAGKKTTAATAKSMERPKSAKAGSRPTSSRDRPAPPRPTKKELPKTRTVNRSPVPRNGSAWHDDDDDPGSVSQDESTGSMDRSPSSASLSSTDGRIPLSPEHLASRKSPGPRAARPIPRPTSLFKNKQDRTRLPMASPRRN